MVFVLSLVLLWIAAWGGVRLRMREGAPPEDVREDFGIILAGTLTLLGLIIGFSFSMATTRYDLRKSYEEAEANAIGTEYVRADLLPEAEAAKVRPLLRQYTDLRIRFYDTRSQDDLKQINQETAQVQNELWTAVARLGDDPATPVRALVIAGMNDVLNSQGYTQAAWWNRIPAAAWVMLFVIAIFANLLLGFTARSHLMKLFVVLPLLVSISFLLIADVDSPRGGYIRVRPQNLISLQSSISAQ